MKLVNHLLDFSDENQKEKIFWNLRDAFQGVQIFGGIGSGKTSGSGKTLASSFLKNGFGGLVLCAKPDEKKKWQELAKLNGRSNDVKIFCEPKTNEPEYFFNPLSYEASRKGGGETYNLVNLFMNIYKMGRIISGEGLANSGERFWDNALKRCLSRLIDFLKLANEPVTIENMNRLISDSLINSEINYFNTLRADLNINGTFEKIKKLAEENFYVRCYLKSYQELAKLSQDKVTNSQKTIAFKHQLKTSLKYFEKEFANLAEKTKAIIVESFLGLTEPFQSGILKHYFASNNENTILPEEIFEHGKIIILDFPIKDYLDAGIYAQGIFKLLFQQVIERRIYDENKDIPAFLWVDEAQNFINDYDQIFQTTARSAGVSTVFISQNISNYYVAIGGKNPIERVNSLLGNLSTKIFHNNNDYVTNEWASKLIGKSWQDISGYHIGDNQTINMSKQYHWQFEPNQFAFLKTGGEDNDFKVQAVIVASRELITGKNYILRSFNQN